MTLWQLAQEIRGASGSPLISPLAAIAMRGCADRIEQWARQKAKEYAALDEPLILIDLGVPEEKP